MYSTENGWRKHGGISKINLYYNKESGCLTGLKVTYGNQGDSARLLGTDRVGQATAELSLQPKELLNDAVIKYSSCITFLSLTTNARKVLAIGNSATPGTLQASSPGPEGGFLAYMKAYTDESGYGALQRLQLVWATLDCASSPAKAPQPIDAPAAVDKMESAEQNATAAAGMPAMVPMENEGACSPGAICAGGLCATSSCALNGMGKDVLTMMCFGTNIMPNPLLDATLGNPCTNLACKLDRPNCTSAGLLGLGGFCTGKVVSMGATAKLHPVGQAFLGYPCVEHQGPVLNLLPLGDYSAKGTFAPKAWKVCDCIQGWAIHEGAIGVMARSDGDVSLTLPDLPTLPHFPFLAKAIHEGAVGVLARSDGDVSLTLPDLPTLPHFPFLAKGLINMSLPDVLAQWVAANQANIRLPQVELSPQQIREIEIVLPGFMAPSVILSKLGAPLFRKPAGFKLPVFTPPSGNNTLRRLAAAIPDLTSLPTLVVPRLHKPVLPTVAVTLPEVTIPSLFDVAPAFGVPTLPRLPPVFNMSFQDAVMQWMAAKAMNLQVPELRLHEQVIRGLQSLVDGFIAPALLVSNISLPLFQPPKGLNLPIIVLNHNQSSALSQVLPRLTALPTIVAPQKLNFRLPKIDLPTITVPNVADVISSLGATLTKWPKLPLALPGSSSSSNDSMAQGLGLSLTLPDLEALIRSKLPGNNNNNNVTGMQLPDALSSLQVEAPEEAAMPTPNFQFDFSGIQEIAAAIKAGLRGRLPQIEEVSIEKLIPADGDAAAVGTKSVTIDGVNVAITPKRVAGSSKASHGSTWGGKRQQ
ncbi:hypothetical protein OEZ86_009515 [Tetradesmus obliquus]|nr:hypothetical protein OEZ86_009515 [Tetradesmus obliquus]WIA42976.1 hypothetical protein OEZ86_009515 [Tetradesmus obliquus]